MNNLVVTGKTSTLGDGIHEVVEKAYKGLSPVCKPVLRSNNIKEWTVLAAVVAVNKDSNKEAFRLISMATGVKSTPNDDLKRSQGKILHDCHAEILAMRGMNRVLLEHVKKLKSSGALETDLIVKSSSNETYQLKPVWKLALYISALPCGDASMYPLSKDEFPRGENNQEICIRDDDSIQFVKDGNTTTLRGRMNYRRLGVTRTKPGRIDSIITLSKSCSDKLCLKQATSVLNAINWSLISPPIFLDYLVVPSKDYCCNDLTESFHNRLNTTFSVPLEILTCSKSFVDEKRHNNQEPSPMSSIKLFFDLPYLLPVEQAILNGLKNGFYTRGTKPLRKNCESIVSRYSQWKYFRTFGPDKTKQTYLEFKKSQCGRRKMIDEVKKLLSPDGWISTMEDDAKDDSENLQ